jgi:EAL domain-containing protein (putative c-di-GMP-specific phosphodiesterase class I)
VVLREACRQKLRVAGAGLPAVRVAVNISASPVQRSGFSRHGAGSAARETGLEARHGSSSSSPRAIIMHDAGRATDSLEQLKTLGLELAIDDFGNRLFEPVVF